jgi:MFS family permease
MSPPHPRTPSLLPYRWELLAWLWLAYFLNQADRQIFGVVLPLVKADLGLTDIQAGLVASLFIVAFGLIVPVAGYAGDVLSRKWVVITSLAVWSIATVLTGFGTGLASLIIVRSLATGVGEAFYAPAAHALIGEHHAETRAQALSLHQSALYFGVVVSGLVAGWVGQQYGWRTAFWLFGWAGMVLVLLLVWRLKGGRTTRTEAQPSAWIVAKKLVRIPAVPLLGLSFAGMVFANNGYLTWTPTYLHEQFHLTLAEAGFASMFYHHAGALLGVLLGGRLSDRWAETRPSARPQLQAIALLAGAPFLYWIGRSESPAAVYLALGCFGVCRGIYDSNMFASVFEVVEPRYHASGAALFICFGFTMGALSPLALGAAKATIGLAGGLSALSVVYLLAGAALLMTARLYFPHVRNKAVETPASSG